MDEAQLDALATRAWRDVDEMLVLGDYLLERELITISFLADTQPWARYLLECEIRRWILRRFYSDALRLDAAHDRGFVVRTAGGSYATVRAFGATKHPCLLTQGF